MKLLIVQFSQVSYYILHTKVNAAAREDRNFQILYTVPIAPIQATCPAYFFVPRVVMISAAECALCGSSLCSCQSYLQSWVQILCPVASHWFISQIVVKLRNKRFCAKFQPLDVCWQKEAYQLLECSEF